MADGLFIHSDLDNCALRKLYCPDDFTFNCKKGLFNRIILLKNCTNIRQTVEFPDSFLKSFLNPDRIGDVQKGGKKMMGLILTRVVLSYSR